MCTLRSREVWILKMIQMVSDLCQIPFSYFPDQTEISAAPFLGVVGFFFSCTRVAPVPKIYPHHNEIDNRMFSITKNVKILK